MVAPNPTPRFSPSGPIDTGASSGTLQTTSNQGGGAELALSVAGSDAPFRTLVAGPNVGILTVGDTLVIEASPGGPVSSDTVDNDSAVDGGAGSVTDALNTLNNGVTNNANDITTINNLISNLGTDDIDNDTAIPGANLSAVLNSLNSDISTNTGDIAIIIGDIATNTGDIATNTGDIATNTGDIATNTGDIATLQTDKLETTSNSGGGEGLALAKVGTDAPFKTLVGGSNITLTPSPTEIAISLNPGTLPTLPTLAGKNNYSPALITQGDAIWFGAGGGQGNAFLSTVQAESTTIPLQNMSCAVSQAPVGAGGISMAIYDSAGLLLARTDIVSAVVGFQTLPLTFGAGLALMAGSQYFFGLYANQTAQFGNYLGAGGLPAGLRLAFSIPNSGGIVGAVNGWPLDVSGFFGNLTTNRFYQLAFG